LINSDSKAVLISNGKGLKRILYNLYLPLIINYPFTNKSNPKIEIKRVYQKSIRINIKYTYNFFSDVESYTLRFDDKLPVKFLEKSKIHN